MIFLGGIFMNVKAIMCDIDGTLLSSDEWLHLKQ